MKVTALVGFLWLRYRFLLIVARFILIFFQGNDRKYECMLYNLFEPLIEQLFVRQGSSTNLLSCKGSIGYKKSTLYYATQWRTFRNCFSFENGFSCILKNNNCETIKLWKLLSPEFIYKVISTVNIVHTYFSFLPLSLHSHIWYLQIISYHMYS